MSIVMKVYVVSILLVALTSTVLAAISSDLRPKVSASFSTGYIINGHQAEPHSAPFIVSLKKISHFCAGSIISTKWVVTAAHCLIYSNFEVIAGLHNRANETGAAIRSIRAKDCIKHKLFGGDVGPYDIGLIKIRRPFIFSDWVNAIALPETEQEHHGKGVLYGWGVVAAGGLPNILQTVDTMIIPYDACKDLLPASAPIKPTNICSHTDVNNATGISACSGDSGGPLIQFHDNKQAKLVGIVSWGYIPCGENNLPSIYTHTSDYISWIKITKLQMN